MTASAHQELPLPLPHRDRFIGLRTTADQELVIRKAAELSGWTVAEFVLCAVLDRAERDVHEHAARAEWETAADTATVTAEPFESLIRLYGEL